MSLARKYSKAWTPLEELEKRSADEPNAIDEAMEELEVGLRLLGATAIEDKLQEGVPELLAALPKLRVLDLRGNPLADGARGGDRWAELSACRSSDEIKQ